MLVLKTLSNDPMHGFAMPCAVPASFTDEVIQDRPTGSLYPALYRMELKDGLRPNGE